MSQLKTVKKVNFIHLSGQTYSKPVEITGTDTNSSGMWIIRKIKIIFEPNQWVDLVFENIDFWNQVKNLSIGSYIEVIGYYKNTFSRKYRGEHSQIMIDKIIHIEQIKTTFNEKFLMSLEKINERIQKEKK